MGSAPCPPCPTPSSLVATQNSLDRDGREEQRLIAATGSRETLGCVPGCVPIFLSHMLVLPLREEAPGGALKAVCKASFYKGGWNTKSCPFSFELEILQILRLPCKF